MYLTEENNSQCCGKSDSRKVGVLLNVVVPGIRPAIRGFPIKLSMDDSGKK